MRRLKLCLLAFLLLNLHLATGCSPVDDDDDSAADDDDDLAVNDDDSAGDDDDSAGGDADAPLTPCAYALSSACADEVVDAPGASPDLPFLEPARATNGVRGAGATSGGFDVFSLDFGAGSSLTLRWSERRVQNAPGVDFVVFENAFESGGPDSVFMDPLVVELSQDGASWLAFPHDYTAADEAVYSTDPADWPGFAGLTPVLLHDEDHAVDPLDPSVAGGDGFDLDDLPDDGGLGEAIKAGGFTFLRLVAAPSRDNPDTGAPYVADVVSNGADIDGVYAASLVVED